MFRIYLGQVWLELGSLQDSREQGAVEGERLRGRREPNKELFSARKQVIARTFSSGEGTAGAWPADFLTRAEQGGSVDWFKFHFWESRHCQ